MRKFQKGDIVVIKSSVNPSQVGIVGIVENVIYANTSVMFPLGDAHNGYWDTKRLEFATSDEAQKLFKGIQRIASVWKPPVREFKAGDVVKNVNASYMGTGTILCVDDGVAFIHFPDSQTGMKKRTTYRFDELTPQGDCNCD